MSRLFNRLKPQKPVDMIGDYRQNYNVKVRFGMLGPVAAGKSTICAGIVHICNMMSSTDTNFFARVLPTSTHILSDANNLKLGRFPEKTDPFLPRAPEAGLLICERGWKEKKVQMPICDVAGEITDYIHSKASGFTPSEIIKSQIANINRQVVEYVRDSQGQIIALAAPDALMFRDQPSFNDPDTYCYTVLNDIFEYRRANHRGDPDIIVIITKIDEVADKCQDIDMDAYNPNQQYGLSRFLANGFPQTNMLVKPLVEKGKVKFFRSWFKTRKRQDGSDEVWPGTTKKIIELYEQPDDFIRWRPKMAEQDYEALVHHIASFGQ